MTRTRSGSALAALAFTTLLTAPAFGQDASAGREGRLSYGVGLDYDFDTGLEAISDVALTLLTRTRSQDLEFGIGTELFGDYTDGGTDEFDFRNSFARIIYTRRGAASELGFSATYRESNLADEIVDGLITDQGVLTTTEFTGRYQYGEEGPFGLTFDARYRERSYEDADPTLFDDTFVSFNALGRFGVSQNMDLRALAGISREEDEDPAGTETEVSYVGVGVATRTADGLSASADLIFDRAETSTTTPMTSTVEDGLGFELFLNQTRPNGFVGAALSSRIDDAGRRTRGEVTRNFRTRTGSLEVSLGVVDQEGVDDLELIGGLSYTIETPRSVFTAEVERDTVTDDGVTDVDTSLQLAFRREINAVSGFEAELGFFETEQLGGTDSSRTTASVAYTRNLTDEWNMQTGYAYSKDDDGDAENSVFFNIQRDITFGF